MEEKQTNEGFNEEMLPTIENFEWLPEFEKILKTFMLKAPIEKVGVAVYEKMSFFKPPLSQVRNFVAHNLKMLTFFQVPFTRFSHQAAHNLARTIIDFGTKTNFMFWIDLFEPYVIYPSRYDMCKVFLFYYVGRMLQIKNIRFNLGVLNCILSMLDEKTHIDFLREFNALIMSQYAERLQNNTLSEEDKESLRLIDEFAVLTRQFLVCKARFLADIVPRWSENFCVDQESTNQLSASFEDSVKRLKKIQSYEVTFRDGVDVKVAALTSESPEMKLLVRCFATYR